MNPRALVAACAFALLAACATAPAPTTAAEIGIAVPPGASPWFAGHYTERVLMFHDGYAAPMNGGVAFVGDSITEGGPWEAMFPNAMVRNYGIGGDTTVGLDLRFAQIVAARPAKVFLLIGTNDLNNDHRSPAEILTNYAGLLDRFARELPATRVYVEAVLPREQRNAEGVREINRGLQQLASVRGLAYLDIYTPFMVGDGVLDPSVTEDSLHLNASGYQRWQTILAPLVDERF